MANLCEEKAGGFALRSMNHIDGVRGERTFATEEHVREAKQLIRELKYTNILDYLRQWQSLDLTIWRSGDVAKDEVELSLARIIICVVGRTAKFATDEEWVEKVLRVGLQEASMV
ncbi:hypothetical protein Q9L58_009658 [Maublancomyces gigas]|uniref:Uncharacterized protein n=1 Tax=Discina gigas TaxID=1032678 RepID=A0ABR3G6T1_9PEZI